VVKFLDSHASACRTLCQLFARYETLGGDNKGVGRKALAMETAQAHRYLARAGIYGALDRSIKAVD
jgi:hypothetical protein